MTNLYKHVIFVRSKRFVCLYE